MMTEGTFRYIVLTGLPGCGKTTLVKKVCKVLNENSITLNGFFTEEIREGKDRIGFDVVLLNGKRAPLARVKRGYVNGPSVGKYAVDVNSFESCALPSMVTPIKNSVLVLDEIGKMELLSKKFTETVTRLINTKESIILATVPSKSPTPASLVEVIKTHPNTVLITVDKGNRDLLEDKIIKLVLEAMKKTPTS